MNDNLSKIALMSVYFEQKRSFFDVYLPFIIQICRKKEITKLSDLEEEIDKIFGFKLLINTIKTILTENETKYFVLRKPSRSDWEIVLTDEAKRVADELIVEEDEVRTDIEFFENEAIEFMNKNSESTFDKNELHDQIKLFFKKNSDRYFERKTLSSDGCTEFDKSFILYLNTIVRFDNRKDDIAERMWKGAVLLSQMQNNQDKKKSQELIGNIDIYIDTNIIFSLLELHSDIVNKAISELFELIKANEKISMYVLDTTINEFDRMLNAYEDIKNDFFDIEVDSVFYHLKKKGYDSTRILELKENVVKLLENKHIKYRDTKYLEATALKYYSHVFTPLYKVRIDRNQKKPESIQKSDGAIERAAHHDAFMIGYTLQFKNKRTYNFSETKCLFLTGSGSLYYDYLKLSRSIENYPVVIRDITLTNLLYMLTPNLGSGPNLEQILSAHTNLLFIDSNIWQRYISALKEMVRKEQIDMKQYALLVSNNKTVVEYISDLKDKDVNVYAVTEILNAIETEEKERKRQLDNAINIVYEKESEIEKLKRKMVEMELEQERLKEKIKEEEITKRSLEYEKEMEEYIDPILKNIIFKKIIWTLIYYVFIAGSFIVFILNNSEINIYVSILLFILPWVRSFIKHDNIIKNTKLIFSKSKRRDLKKELHAQEVEKYYKNHPKDFA